MVREPLEDRKQARQNNQSSPWTQDTSESYKGLLKKKNIAKVTACVVEN